MGVYGGSTFQQGDGNTPAAHPAPASSQCTALTSVGNALAVSTTSGASATTTVSLAHLQFSGVLADSCYELARVLPRRPSRPPPARVPRSRRRLAVRSQASMRRPCALCPSSQHSARFLGVRSFCKREHFTFTTCFMICLGLLPLFLPRGLSVQSLPRRPRITYTFTLSLSTRSIPFCHRWWSGREHFFFTSSFLQ